jgi:hypothetical protein
MSSLASLLLHNFVRLLRCYYGLWKIQNNDAGFGVLTAVTMKSTTFWGVTSYSPVKVHRCFGTLSRLLLAEACLAYSSILKMQTVRSS